MLESLIELFVRLFRRPTKLCSGTRDFPGPKDLIAHLLNLYLAEGDAQAEFVTFELGADEDKWVQVACDDPDQVVINCRYPYTEPPHNLLAARGVLIPSEFTLNRFETAKYAEFIGPRCAASTLAAFVDSWFLRMLDCTGGYHLRGYLQE